MGADRHSCSCSEFGRVFAFFVCLAPLAGGASQLANPPAEGRKDRLAENLMLRALARRWRHLHLVENEVSRGGLDSDPDKDLSRGLTVRRGVDSAGPVKEIVAIIEPILKELPERRLLSLVDPVE